VSESKNEKFKRLAAARGNRVIHELGLLGNLANEQNYQYSESEVRQLFGVIEAELRECKARFNGKGSGRKVEFS